MATTVTLKPNAIDISGATSGTTTLQATAVAGTTTLTLPAATDTLVGKATTDTLTNKTLTGAVMNGTLGATTPSTVAATSITASTTFGVTGVATFSAGTAALPAITTTGDTNTGIFFPAADTIAFTEGGVESMRIDASGNVGIGVTPSAWGSGFKALQLNSQTGLFGSADSTFLQTNAYINSAGTNIYIGTGFATRYRQDGGVHQWHTAASGTAGNTISFTQAMTLDASGNLGIGTTSPTRKLDVRQAYTADTIVAQIGNTNNGNGATPVATIFDFTEANGTSVSRISSIYTQSTGKTDLAFGTYNGGLAEKMRLDSSGNLLVGTTSANGKLSVSGGAVSSSTFMVDIRNGTYVGLRIRDDGFAFMPSTYDKTIGSAANMYIDSGGVIYRSTSSLKYKTEVKDTLHGLTEVLTLRPVTYKGKSDADAGKIFGGLIAEEVHAAGLTEFVQYAEDGSPDALHYGNMVSLCIKAIQEQQALITQLTARITALEGA